MIPNKDTRNEIRALCDNATPGPWEIIDNRYRYPIGLHRKNITIAEMVWKDKDAEFISCARQVLPSLLDALDKYDEMFNNNLDGMEINKNCEHAGDCEGCITKQSECLSYMHFLTHKYKKLAISTTAACEKAIDERNNYKALIEKSERLKTPMKIDYDQIVPKCPNCGKLVYDDPLPMNCLDCGQCLDWEK